MDKRVIILIILLLGSLFAGCIGDESIAGKYVAIENNKSYFILYDDGTFNEWYSDGSSGSGTYRFEDKRLALTYVPFGNVNLFTHNGTAFIYDGGWKYVKE